MMAPHYERASVLHEAIELAVGELQEPICRIVVSRGTIACCGSTKRVVASFDYQNAYSPEGSPMPGSGSWQLSNVRISQIGILERLWLRLT